MGAPSGKSLWFVKFWPVPVVDSALQEANKTFTHAFASISTNIKMWHFVQARPCCIVLSSAGAKKQKKIGCLSLFFNSQCAPQVLTPRSETRVLAFFLKAKNDSRTLVFVYLTDIWNIIAPPQIWRVEMCEIQYWVQCVLITTTSRKDENMPVGQ